MQARRLIDHGIDKTFKDAVDRHVNVWIVHGAKPGKRSTKENEEVIQLFGLEDFRTKRTTVHISHNKIVIRLVNGTPRKIWTGSTNFSKASCNDSVENAMNDVEHSLTPKLLKF